MLPNWVVGVYFSGVPLKAAVTVVSAEIVIVHWSFEEESQPDQPPNVDVVVVVTAVSVTVVPTS
ncbi:hypothetical protein MBAV_004810 [Candidatus Magnetobacterium bavaricum]|uniref:Uncharacterized protein n=1 Tax=Candidatus Magnetobacterium bavaricum TaxID=29290 RepID=A0A0F3GMF0_9BACT|nr:hypothetical protein MBAV_004810 [Candidatus Magnetobacterium bavaricum]